MKQLVEQSAHLSVCRCVSLSTLICPNETVDPLQSVPLQIIRCNRTSSQESTSGLISPHHFKTTRRVYPFHFDNNTPNPKSRWSRLQGNCKRINTVCDSLEDHMIDWDCVFGPESLEEVFSNGGIMTHCPDGSKANPCAR